MAFSKEERETIITMCDDSDEVQVFTRQQRVMNKMSKLGIEPIDTLMEDDKIIQAEYILNRKQISFRKERQLTDEQRKAIGERLAKNRI